MMFSEQILEPTSEHFGDGRQRGKKHSHIGLETVWIQGNF
jgi:hypothetical protein